MEKKKKKIGNGKVKNAKFYMHKRRKKKIDKMLRQKVCMISKFLRIAKSETKRLEKKILPMKEKRTKTLKNIFLLKNGQHFYKIRCSWEIFILFFLQK